MFVFVMKSLNCTVFGTVVLPKQCDFDFKLSPTAIVNHFHQVWQERVFNSYLTHSDVDSAWALLSDTAETVLTTQSSSAGIPRSQFWVPGQRSHLAKAAKQAESTILRRCRCLRRLLLNLQALSGKRCLQGLRYLAIKFPQLPQHPTFRELNEDTLRILDSVCTDLEHSERNERLRKWQAETHASPAKQVAWIKRRNALLRELQQQPLSVDSVFYAKRPTVIVKEQEELWQNQWITSSPPPVHGGINLHNCGKSFTKMPKFLVCGSVCVLLYSPKVIMNGVPFVLHLSCGALVPATLSRRFGLGL